MALIATQGGEIKSGDGPLSPALEAIHSTQNCKASIRRAGLTTPFTRDRQIKVVVAAAARGVVTEDDFRAAGVKPPHGQSRETVFALATFADHRVLNLGVDE